MSVFPTISRLWAKADHSAVRAFLLSMTALAAALLLALYSGAAAELGQLAIATTTAVAALVIAAWVGITLVPILAKRTPLRWIGYKMEYRVTLEGWIYLAGIVLVALAALNTGNNLLFLILSSLIALVLMSGILSSITLSGVGMRLVLPEHIFAGQPVRAMVELENEKMTLPSFSLRVEATKPKHGPAAALLDTPVYFPYLPKHDSVQQTIPVTFPRRGVYRQEAFRIVTRFPFGFLRKARQLNLKTEALVYPSVEPSPEYLEILQGLQGALESITKGRGQDLYALRGYVPTDSARHVHWKASARSGSLMVREFTREDDCRVLLVLDPHLSGGRILPAEACDPRDPRAFRAYRHHLRQPGLALLRKELAVAVPHRRGGNSSRAGRRAHFRHPPAPGPRATSATRSRSKAHGRSCSAARSFQDHRHLQAPRLHSRLCLELLLRDLPRRPAGLNTEMPFGVRRLAAAFAVALTGSRVRRIFWE